MIDKIGWLQFWKHILQEAWKLWQYTKQHRYESLFSFCNVPQQETLVPLSNTQILQVKLHFEILRENILFILSPVLSGWWIGIPFLSHKLLRYWQKHVSSKSYWQHLSKVYYCFLRPLIAVKGNAQFLFLCNPKIQALHESASRFTSLT